MKDLLLSEKARKCFSMLKYIRLINMKCQFYKIMIFVIVIAVTSCSSNEDKLFRAINNGDSEKVSGLLENGVSVLATNKNGLTPLDIARLRGETEIAELIYEQVKQITEKDIGKILKGKFINDLRDLKEIEVQRVKSYNSYLSSNEKLLNMISDDKRISDDLILEEEKNFKSHQILIKTFINKKVDLIDEIEIEFNRLEYSSNISVSDKRHIINVNIMFNLSSMR